MTLADIFADPAKVLLIVDALNNRADVLKEVAARGAAELGDGDNPALVLDALADAGRLSSIVSAILSAPIPAGLTGTPEAALDSPPDVKDPLTAGESPVGDEVLARLAARAAIANNSRILSDAGMSGTPARADSRHESPAPQRGPFTLDPAAVAAALDEADQADDPAERARAAALDQLDATDEHPDLARPLPSRYPPHPLVDLAALAARLEPPDLDTDDYAELGERLATTEWPPASVARHPDLPARPAGTPDDTAEALNVLANLEQPEQPDACEHPAWYTPSVEDEPTA